MADKETTIEIKTVATGTGAKDTATELEKVVTKETEVAKATGATTQEEKKLEAAIRARFDAAEAEVAARGAARREEQAAAREQAGAAEEGQKQSITAAGLLGRMAAVAAVAAAAFRTVGEFAKIGAANGNVTAQKVAEDFSALGVAWDNVKTKIAGSGIGEAVGNTVRMIASIAGPSDAATRKMKDLAAGMENAGIKGEQSAIKLSRVTEELQRQNEELRRNKELTTEVASNAEREADLFKRQRLAGIDPNASEEDKARQTAKIEREASEEIGAIRDEQARRNAAAVEAELNLKLRQAKELETSGNVDRERADKAQRASRAATQADKRQEYEEQAKAARTEAAAKEANAKALRDEVTQRGGESGDVLAARQRARVLEDMERQTQAKEAAVTEREAKAKDEAAKARAEADAAREAAKQEKEAARNDEGVKPPKGQVDIGNLGGDAAALSNRANKGTPFPERDQNLRALGDATAALQDGATLQELGALASALQQFSATLGGLKFGEQISRLQKEISDIKAREAANRK